MKHMVTKLFTFLRGFTFYDDNLCENKAYKHYLNDMKGTSLHEISATFHSTLDGLDKLIVEYDIKMYQSKGNDNAVRLSMKHNVSESVIKKDRGKLKQRLYGMYLFFKSRERKDSKDGDDK